MKANLGFLIIAAIVLSCGGSNTGTTINQISTQIKFTSKAANVPEDFQTRWCFYSISFNLTDTKNFWSTPYEPFVQRLITVEGSGDTVLDPHTLPEGVMVTGVKMRLAHDCDGTTPYAADLVNGHGSFTHSLPINFEINGDFPLIEGQPTLVFDITEVVKALQKAKSVEEMLHAFLVYR